MLKGAEMPSLGMQNSSKPLLRTSAGTLHVQNCLKIKQQKDGSL